MSSQEEIEVGLCSDDDIALGFEALSRGFGHDAPFWDAYFPGHDTMGGQTEGIRRLLHYKHSDEESYFVKAFIPATDEKREKVIGLAMWTHMTEPPSDKLDEVEDVAEAWPDEDDRDYMRQLWKDYVVPRSNAVKEAKGAGIMVLEILAVDREHQRKGAGTALVRWGTDKADEKGLESVVEGTPQGLKCYQNGGFQTEIEEMKFDVGERFADRRKIHLTFLKRKPKNSEG